MPEKVLEFQKVSYSYGGPPVLEDVDLAVHRGDFVALVGPNGGGKTTLVKLALGLLAPTSGAVRVLGMRPDQVLGRVGYVPQHATQRSGFPVTVLDTVRMGLKRGHGLFNKASERKAALDALARVNLDHKAQARFGELSGGQQQRALIARALASKAEMLILDEPTANIDPQGSFCFFDFLCELGKAESLTILSVSHDLTIAASHVTAMACVNRRLLYNPAPALTPEMLHMLYGSHQHTCAMDEHIRRLEQFMGDHMHEGEQEGEARQ